MELHWENPFRRPYALHLLLTGKRNLIQQNTERITFGKFLLGKISII